MYVMYVMYVENFQKKCIYLNFEPEGLRGRFRATLEEGGEGVAQG